MNEKDQVQMTVFGNEELGVEVRTIMRNGEPWFIAKDVCDALGFSKYRDAIAKLDSDERRPLVVDTSAGARTMAAINESGLYAIIMKSRKPTAKKFRKWVTSEVLPSIRKTGSYGMKESYQIKDPAERARAWAAEYEERRKLEAGVKQLAAVNEEMKPKAEFYDTIIHSDSTIDIGEVAKALNYNIGGRNKLFRFLREQGILMKNNVPKQVYVDRGYFKVIETSWQNSSGDVHAVLKTVVYQKGIHFIKNLLDKAGYVPVGHEVEETLETKTKVLGTVQVIREVFATEDNSIEEEDTMHNDLREDVDFYANLFSID